MNYPYAVGQIKAIENSIFDRNQYSKLMKTEKKQFLKTLADLGYGELQNSLEQMINQEMKRVKQFLDEMSPERKYTDLFFFVSDALNIKALYKIKVYGINDFDIYQETGTISKETLKKAILEGDLSSLSNEQKNLFIKINGVIIDANNARILSARIDDCIYDYIFDQIKHSKAKALLDYYQSKIDFSNVLTYIRSKRLHWDYQEFEEMFIHNGQVDITLFKEIYDGNYDQIARGFRSYYNERIVKGLKFYFESKDVDFLERYFDKLTLEIMKEYQYDSFGIGPIIYYYLKKQAEAKNIRLVYSNNEIDTIDLLV